MIETDRKVGGGQRERRSGRLQVLSAPAVPGAKGGESSWRASLHAPQGGEPLHFAGLSELVTFLEQEGDPANGVGGQGRAEEPTAGEEGDLDD